MKDLQKVIDEMDFKDSELDCVILNDAQEDEIYGGHKLACNFGNHNCTTNNNCTKS